MKASPGTLCKRLLDVVESEVLPLSRKGVAAGNKIFGAAVLRKSDLSLVIAGTNNEVENPLNHGEISTLNAFYALPTGQRPATGDCIFVSTHEPCSLCLSAITWAGFDNFFYFFGYQDTRDAFNIPHDLRILEEVFKVKDGAYARQNVFWNAEDLVALSNDIGDNGAASRSEQIARIRVAYDDLSQIYQASKSDNDIPLS